MRDNDLPTLDQLDDETEAPGPVGSGHSPTETIELSHLLLKDVTLSGSFDLRGVQATSLGKLLQSMPIPAFLLNRSSSIIFSNNACGNLSPENEKFNGSPFPSLFLRDEDGRRVQSIVGEVFSTRRPQMAEALLAFGAGRIWGRMHFRSLRMGSDRCVLVLVEDLTLEKRQLLMTQKHRQELQKARDELEIRVRERTAELTAANEQLTKEIADRKRAEEALRKAHDQLERRVEERTAELKSINEQLTDQIVQRQEAERALQKSEEKFRTIFQHGLDVIIIVDGETGTILGANQAIKNVLDYDVNAIVGKHFSRLYPCEPDAPETGLASRLRISDAVFESQEIKKADGTLVPMDLTATLIPWEKSVAVLATFRDVTDRRGAERALQESEQRFRELAELLPQIVFELDHRGRLTFVNREGLESFGFTREEVARGINALQLVSSGDRERARENLGRLLEGQDLSGNEYLMVRKGGRTFPAVLHSKSIMREGRAVGARGIIVDITERKLWEEAILTAQAGLELRVKERTAELVALNQSLVETERRQKAILDNIPDIAWLKDSEGSLIAVNQPFAQACGLKQEELAGKSDFEIWPEDLAQRYHADDMEVIASRNAKRIEEPMADAGGKITWMETVKTPILNESGEVIGTTGIARDITERKLTEAQIRQSLREKEALLQEVHHRVKNNLQIISSLLALQRSQIEDEKTRGALKDSQSRIRSMSFIHEQLYQAKDLNRIDFAKYIRDLTGAIFQSYSETGARVRLSLNVDRVSLGVGTALPCGLIINELVSNSLKHAFPDDRQGTIGIELRRQDGNKYTLTVTDDGIGLPSELDYLRSKSLGLRLVTNLTELQLRGTLNVVAGKGAQITIQFEEREKNRPGEANGPTNNNDR